MKVLNFGSLNIDYVYQMAHFIRPGETAPCKTLTAGAAARDSTQSIALAKAGTAVYHAGDSTARRRSSCSIKMPGQRA